ncbi:aerobic-type carbon monoxide dehydrogenase, middle subunit CoxM/CutM-like protein [Sphaerochaeta pleomorpha str. Grapes]|uniref:Aerobic-type carbon monoxide dehydrogenase, middle subunit CoxM/CutM-like protein n=1 Tax=Sphaerochaeta pleomorpha (strain ATCC BAA-1885 / DSM 22778 / Grapes) TaxID=158190 RepID=G8QQH1_SPHPG|nr:FAD binding domain-containing protein [Sphaerochaeta pleomorpha]AEV30901.1 aerobic-type carbon monoxide dehydrogenase, middle subunit CoxM/CutM-like protein [Sphaerochaeta pleomorpha str. Grapes]
MVTYIPETLEEALAIRKESGARPLAGGTDLMVQYRRGVGVTPKFPWPIMIVSQLAELKGISQDLDGSCVIGAGVTSTEIAESEMVPFHVREAASRMGAISLRNLATIGGNIGNASPKGDLPAVLILLDASLVLSSVSGERIVLLDDFIVGAKKTLLREDELITKIIIPRPEKPFTYVWYRKIGTRKANAISKLSFSAAMTVDDEGIVTDFRASSGAAGPKIARNKELESTLIGKNIEDLPSMIPAFLLEYDKIISPHAMPEYRRESTKRMLAYFLEQVAKRPASEIIK